MSQQPVTQSARAAIISFHSNHMLKVQGAKHVWCMLLMTNIPLMIPYNPHLKKKITGVLVNYFGSKITAQHSNIKLQF